LPVNSTAGAASKLASMSTNADASWTGLEIRHLAALEAVAREGSFRGAAQRLGYVQSAISHQILALERVVGATLVQRTRGSRLSALTPAGEALLEHASAILARVRVAQADVASIANERDAVFRIGSFQNLAALFATPILPRFRAAVGAGSTVFVEHDTGRAMQGLVRDRDVDVAFTQHPIRDPDLAHADLLEDPYVALVPSGSLVARRRRPVSLEEVARSGLVAHGPSRTRVESQLAARGLRPAIRFRSDNNATVHALVAASVGCAVLPRLAASSSQGVTVLPLDPVDAVPPRRLAIAWLGERGNGREVQEFVAAVTRHATRVAEAVAATGGAATDARRRA
jgi:DNA-binding transcriptional LysR family regulator